MMFLAPTHHSFAIENYCDWNRINFAMSLREKSDWKRFVDYIPPVVERVVEDRDVPPIDGVCEIIKDNSVRTVARLFCSKSGQSGTNMNLGTADLFLKRYKRRNWKDLLKSIVLPSKAYREANMAEALLACGIPTAKPIAAVEKRRWGILYDSYLITESISNSVSLREFALSRLQCRNGNLSSEKISPSCVFREKKNLLRSFASLMRKLNENKFFHRDFHAGNVLLKKDESEKCVLYLMDLHSVRRLRWMSFTREIRALAQLNYTHAFNNITATDRLRFLKYYNPPLSKDELKKWALSVNRMTQKLRGLRARRRTKRCLKNNSRFEVKRVDNRKIYLRRGVSEKLILNAIGLHKEFVGRLGQSESGETEASTKQIEAKDRNSNADESPKLRIIKDSPKRVVSLLSNMCGKGIDWVGSDLACGICIKHYRDDGLLLSIKNMLRRSPAKRSWVAGNGLRIREIPAADPIALVEERHGFLGLSCESFLVMKAIKFAPEGIYHSTSGNINDEDGMIDLSAQAIQVDDYVKRFFGNITELGKSPRLRAEKRAFIKEFATAFREFHDKGIYHKDMKASNILVTEIGDARWRFSLVDLDGVKFGIDVSARHRRKNIAQMNSAMPRCVTLTDRLRFFRWYTRGRGISGKKVFPDEKRAMRQLIKATSKRSCVWER